MERKNSGTIQKFVLLTMAVFMVLFASCSTAVALSTSGRANNHIPPGHTIKLNPGEKVIVNVQSTEPVRIEVLSMKLYNSGWAYNKIGETKTVPIHKIELNAPNKPPVNNMSHWHFRLQIWGEGDYTLYTEPGN